MVKKVTSLTERLTLQESEALMSSLDEKRKDTIQIKLLPPCQSKRKIIKYAISDSYLLFDYGKSNYAACSGIPVTLWSPSKASYNYARSLIEKPLDLPPMAEEAHDW